MMKSSRTIREKWCNMAVLIVITAAMLTASITPALAAILLHPANLANTTGYYQAGGD